MKAETWVPGSNSELDDLFNQLRIQQYNDKSHRLWKNYSEEFLKYTIALTICFDESGNPEMCSSIASRDCWPNNAYRILNRLWKVSEYRKKSSPKVMSPSFGYSAISQIDWLNRNVGDCLYFISRETDNWEHWVSRQFSQVYGVDFKIAEGKFLTCPNECDSSCWQKIIYSGQDNLLAQWKKQI